MEQDFRVCKWCSKKYSHGCYEDICPVCDEYSMISRCGNCNLIYGIYNHNDDKTMCLKCLSKNISDGCLSKNIYLKLKK